MLKRCNFLARIIHFSSLASSSRFSKPAGGQKHWALQLAKELKLIIFSRLNIVILNSQKITFFSKLTFSSALSCSIYLYLSVTIYLSQFISQPFSHNTCQGYSFSSVSAPPTILVLRFARPHLCLGQMHHLKQNLFLDRCYVFRSISSF